MSSDTAITVALVEDDEPMRERLSRVLQRSTSLSLVFMAATAGQMLHWLRGGSANVVLVDLGLPDQSGLEVIRYCHHHAPATDVMVVSMFGDESSMIRAFEAGARGYLLKDGTEDDLAKHVMNLHAGGSPMTPLIARQLLQRLSVTKDGSLHSVAEGSAAMMSEREREILLVLSRGYTYAEAGALLSIATSTVQSHVKNIYSKLAVRSKTEAIFEARQMGLL